MNKRLSSMIRWLSLTLAAAIALVGAMALLRGAQAMGEAVQAVKIGLITDPAGLDDDGWNMLSVAGLNRAIDELGVVGTVYTTTTDGDFITRTEECVSDENALCIGVGFWALEAISQSAHTHPEVKFAVIDGTFEDYPANLQGMRFSSQEPSYMAGTLASLMTESDKLGVIGGMDIPNVNDFIDGFVQGAACANPDVTTIVTYTNDFVSPTLGAEFAQLLLAEGADVIFPVAGGAGSGALITSTQSGAWAIGVDTDQYLTVFMSGTITGSEKMLTSVMKRVDNAVFILASDVISGTFISGTVSYDMQMGGVQLAPYHEADASIPDPVKAQVERARQGILAGTIDIYGTCPSYVYLPYTTRGDVPTNRR